MKRIGIISDTHNVLREEVVNHLQGCDMIFHAGDVCGEDIVKELEKIAPVYVVGGNNDKDEWGKTLPHSLKVEIEGVTFYIIHDRNDLSQDLVGIDVLICGHSHRYLDEVVDSIRYLNPGSCGKCRFGLPLTMMLGEIAKDGFLTIKKVDINP